MNVLFLSHPATMTITSPMSSRHHTDPCTSIELRRYSLRPGARSALIDLFERELVVPQEACGMRVIAQFRDLDDANAFVWLRGFLDMAQRARSLAEFYGGPVWAKFADAANATMLNSDNVLLLRPEGSSAFDLALPSSCGLLEVTTCSLPPGAEAEFLSFFEAHVRPALERAQARVLAPLVTEQRPNTFPRLPVRAGETAFVWLAAYQSAEHWAAAQDSLAADADWTKTVLPGLAVRCWQAPHVARLVPTSAGAGENN
jgi:NIPSNAP